MTGTCELCEHPDPVACRDAACGVVANMVDDGESYRRWIKEHCYHCGRHLTPAEIEECESEDF